MKSSRPIRIGVIGLGQIALKAHLPGYAKTKDCELTAVYSQREEHAKRVAAQYGIRHIYKDWRRLLESDQVDAVSICTPNYTHMPIAIKATSEGKHVLVEKPIAMNREEALRMIRTAQKHGRVLMVHHNMRFDPAVRTAEKLLRRECIGHVFAFKSTLTQQGPHAWNPNASWFFNKKKSGGGALMDLGPHHFDSLRFLFHDEAKVEGAIGTWGKTNLSGKGEIHCACLLRFKKGAIGTVTLGWADTSYQNRFYFFGTKGTLSLNLAKGEPITLEYRDREGRAHPSLAKDSFYPSVYEHFIDCIRYRKTPQVSGEEGLKTLELIEASYRFIHRK